MTEGTQLASVRWRIFTFAQLQRHHLVLDLNAATGLLTWEAIRQVPECGVYACVSNSSDANALIERAAALPETMQPIVFTASVAQIPAMLASVQHMYSLTLLSGVMYFDGTMTVDETFVAVLRKFAPVLSAKLLPERHKYLKSYLMAKLDGS
ncbi:MAG: hypothetical protein V7K71_21700 [Nostoc sp.]|uniref:hypothetical protein n=1 Tax=Nostoc sp. TaxID=1180 RepID=UPI002FFB75BC